LTGNVEPIIVDKNRKRALWSLVIVVFFIPISALLVLLGLQPGRPEVSWALVLNGIAGAVTFAASAVAVIRILRSPWHLAIYREQMALYTPNYDLEVPWSRVVGIAVDEINRKPSCVLVFDDVAAVVQRAEFHNQSKRPDAVTSAGTMQARMEENFEGSGYHLTIPSRILELGPEELAELLSKARRGTLWKEGTGR
jgi:hypothetical protein